MLHRVLLGRGDKQLVHLVWAADFVRADVDGQGEEPDEYEQSGRVGPIGKQRGSHTSYYDVEGDEDGDEEDRCLGRHACEIVDRSRL